MARKIKKGKLEVKWSFYTGTGVTAVRGKDALALRERVGGGEFAIVKLYGGCVVGSKMRVLEEIPTAGLSEAKKRFYKIARKKGFKRQPIRTLALLFA